MNKIQDAIEHFEYGISHDIFKPLVKEYSELAVIALKEQLKTSIPTKCSAWHKATETTYIPVVGGHIRKDTEIYVCWGTRDSEKCTCNGDKQNCDFY